MGKKIMLHISPVENRESIKKNGLRLTNGMLFLMEPVEVCYPLFYGEDGLEEHWITLDRLVAWKQLFLPIYDVWMVEVDDKDLEPDDVAEWESVWCHIYRKPIAKARLICAGRILNKERPWENF